MCDLQSLSGCVTCESPIVRWRAPPDEPRHRATRRGDVPCFRRGLEPSIMNSPDAARTLVVTKQHRGPSGVQSGRGARGRVRLRHRPPGYRACPLTAGRPVGFSPVNPGETRGGQPQAGVQAARQAPEDVPDPQGRIARQVFEAVRTELVPADLSFGGGTVLAARWRHRVSLDVGLFCRPDTSAGLDAAARQRIEVQLASIPGCASERT